jgi:hypothetical protein
MFFAKLVWHRCYDFKNIFAKTLAKKLAIFLLKLLQPFAKKLIITMFFKKKCQIFRRKLAEIAANCHHNIGPPWLP